MNWLAAHYQWIVGVVLVPIFVVVVKHWLESRHKAPANTVTQSPTITVAPTFINSPHAALAVEQSRNKIADESEPSPPELRSLEPRTCFVDDENDGFTEGGEFSIAVLATFRMVKPSSDRRGTHITARLSYQTKTDTGIRDDWKEFGRVDYSAWIDEEFNSVSFTMSDTKELILAMQLGDKLVAIKDYRHGVNKRKEPGYFELAPDAFFVVVTLVDEIFGPVITYTYKIESNPLKVTEILRVPRGLT